MNENGRRVVYVDLSKQKVSEKLLSEEVILEYIGGRGVNAKLLWDLVKEPGIDAFSPDNPLIFGSGLFASTIQPSGGRCTVTCKSAVTGFYNKSSSGGHWAAEYKRTGHDHLVIQGASEKPVYITVFDDDIQIHDASSYWSREVPDTDKTIKKDLGLGKAQVMCIGPAGEKLVRFASVMNLYCAAARGGVGAVMGSKKLKAIVVRGSKRVELYNEKEFRRVALAAREKVAKDSGAKSLFDFGTSGALEIINTAGVWPNHNFKSGHMKDVTPLTGQHLVAAGYLKKRVACNGCSIACHRYVEIDEGPYAGTKTGGPEYEAFTALGGQTGVIDTEAVIKANERCNSLGLDVITTGEIIAWAMETNERGVLGEEYIEGMDLKFGNADSEIKLIDDIGYRKTKLGNLLAEGTKRATQKIGQDSWKWAPINSKGLEMSSAEVRSAKGYALAFAVNPRGPDHLHTITYAEFGATPEALDLIERLTGDKKYANPLKTEYRAEIVRWHEDIAAVTEALGMCLFVVTGGAFAVDEWTVAELFTYGTGHNMSESEIMLTGRRILTVEKCFNIREGATRKHDDLPWRIMNEPAPNGPGKGMMVSKEELDGMLDKYYRLHGWDLKTSWPYEKTLKELGLFEEAEELKKLGKLPT